MSSPTEEASPIESLSSICTKKFHSAGLDWAIELVDSHDESVIQLAASKTADLVDIVKPHQKVFIPTLLRLARESIQQQSESRVPQSQFVPPASARPHVVHFAVVGNNKFSALMDSASPLDLAVPVPQGTDMVTFYGSALTDDDVPTVRTLLKNIKNGAFIDLSHNRLTSGSFPFILDLVQQHHAVVAIGGNNSLASVESRPQFQKLFDEAVKEMKAALTAKAPPSTETFSALKRIIFVPAESWLQSDNWKTMLTDSLVVNDPEEQRAREFVFAGIVDMHRFFFRDVLPLMRAYA
jgi:hypothetical protein